MLEKSPKPLRFSKTVGCRQPALASGERLWATSAVGRAWRRRLAPGAVGGDRESPTLRRTRSFGRDKPDECRLEAMLREWLLELRMLGTEPTFV